MTTLRTTAHAFAESMENGFVPLDDLVDWIDSKMHELDKPPIGLIEACCAGRSRQAVADALRTVDGDLDQAASVRQCLWHAAAALERDDSIAERIATWLFHDVGDVVAVLGDELASFDGEFELISLGFSARSRSEVVHALLEQLVDKGERPN